VRELFGQDFMHAAEKFNFICLVHSKSLLSFFLFHESLLKNNYLMQIQNSLCMVNAYMPGLIIYTPKIKPAFLPVKINKQLVILIAYYKAL
jgi:hypothetical protein